MSVTDGPPAGQFPDDLPSHPDDLPSRTVDRPAPAQRWKSSKSRDFDPAVEARAFYAMLDRPSFQAELKGMLPDNISVAAFVRTAKTAVQANADLLDPNFRASLLQSVTKAAAQGLLPDGRHGALVPRWDDKSGKKQVAWQPMVWGITQLGRRAGAIKKMTAHIVFDGEAFEILGGAEDRIYHKIDPTIVERVYAEAVTPDAFFQHIAFAYCIIVAPNDTVTWRYMTRSRIARVRAASAANRGPWNGPFIDEMVLKTLIRFTAKHIDLEGESPEMQRFRDAMETDTDIEFDDIETLREPMRPSLPAPDVAMQTVTDQLLKKRNGDKAPVERSEAARDQERALQGFTKGASDQMGKDATWMASESPSETKAPRGAPELPLTDKPSQGPAEGDGEPRAEGERAQIFFDKMMERLRQCPSKAARDTAMRSAIANINRLASSRPDLHKQMVQFREDRDAEDAIRDRELPPPSEDRITWD